MKRLALLTALTAILAGDGEDKLVREAIHGYKFRKDRPHRRKGTAAYRRKKARRKMALASRRRNRR